MQRGRSGGDRERGRGTWRGRSQVGNLCSAACGKVVARNLEIAEAERGRRKENAGRLRGRERNKKTRGRRVEKERRRSEREACRRGREKRSGSGAKGEGGGGREEMARWSLSVGKRD